MGATSSTTARTAATSTRRVLPTRRRLGSCAVAGSPTVAAIVGLERTHDAVADLLLAESVHQLVSGNPTRAAASLDVLGAGEAVPPEPEVVRTPRTRVPIQHWLAILVADPPPASIASWKSDAPRARAEPRLEAWAQSSLGDSTAIPLAEGDRRTMA